MASRIAPPARLVTRSSAEPVAGSELAAPSPPAVMRRFQQIDILRAIAVFLVLGRHMTPCPASVSPLLHQVTQVWVRGGWIGVDLFFVLSGFLVSGLLFREYEKHRQLHIGHFLIRRGFKIYPPFWLLLAVTALIVTWQHGRLPVRGLVFELIFLQNYGPALWNHTWSLAIEEHFYFILAIGLLALTRWRSAAPFRAIPAAFISVALVCLMLRIATSLETPYNHQTHLFPTHLRLDSLFFGVLLAFFFHRQPVRFMSAARRLRYPILALGVLLLLPAFHLPLETTPFVFTYGLTLFYVGGGCLLIAALGFRAPTARLPRAVAYVGSHSYSVYLWHMPVALWGTAIAAGVFSQHYNWFVYAAVYLVGAVAVGVAMSILIEFPVLRLRDRFFPSRGAPLTTAATEP